MNLLKTRPFSSLGLHFKKNKQINAQSWRLLTDKRNQKIDFDQLRARIFYSERRLHINNTHENITRF